MSTPTHTAGPWLWRPGRQYLQLEAQHGMRYSIPRDGRWHSSWSSLFDIIGWKRAYDALSQAVPA